MGVYESCRSAGFIRPLFPFISLLTLFSSTQVSGRPHRLTILSDTTIENAERAIKDGDDEKAARDLAVAVQIYPANYKYQKLFSKVKPKAAAAKINRLSGYSKDRVAERRALIEEAQQLSKDEASVVEAASQFDRECAEVRTRATEATSLATKDHTRDAAIKIAAQLKPYEPFIPEVVRLGDELKVGELLSAAREKEKRSDFRSALADFNVALGIVPNHPQALQLKKRLTLKLAEALLAEAQSLAILGNYESLTQAADKYIEVQKLSSAESIEVDLSKIVNSLRITYAQREREALAQSSRSRVRLALELHSLWLERYQSRVPWPNGIVLPPAISVFFAVAAPEKCSIDGITGLIKESLTPKSGFLQFIDQDSAAADITISFSNIQCKNIEVPRLDAVFKESTFVAGYRKVQNIEYNRLVGILRKLQQIELQNAMWNAAMESDGSRQWSLSERAKFTRSQIQSLESQIGRTPPYIETPIAREYTYNQFEAYRAHDLSATIAVIDRSGQQPGSDDIFHRIISRGIGISDISPANNVIKNKEPELESFESLRSKAMKQAAQSANKIVKKALIQELVFEAGKEFDQNNRLEALGDLLLLRDLGLKVDDDAMKRLLNGFLRDGARGIEAETGKVLLKSLP